MKLEWIAREHPLAPEACWAEGAAARALKEKIVGSDRNDLQLAQAEDVLVVLGPELPWVDGLIYLGRDQQIYLPTLWQPSIPIAWIMARLRKLGPAPWAIVRSGKVLELNKARALGV